MNIGDAGLVIWDVDGTLIPADLRWLRRAIARTYKIPEAEVLFPDKKVHGYTDESIVVDAAIESGVSPASAEDGISRLSDNLVAVMNDGRAEFTSVQPPYPGVRESFFELNQRGYAQTVLTGNLRPAAEIKLNASGLDRYLDLRIGGFGSDDRDRFKLPAVVNARYAQFYGRPLDPEKVVVIGDAPNDIACAKFAGFHVIVVTHRATRDELEPYDPDAIVDSLAPGELIAKIESVLSGVGRRS